jgi:hypothetical protein
MRSIDTTKPDRKSGGSRGTCGAPFPNATAQVSHLHTKPDLFANFGQLWLSGIPRMTENRAVSGAEEHVSAAGCPKAFRSY